MEQFIGQIFGLTFALEKTLGKIFGLAFGLVEKQTFAQAYCFHYNARSEAENAEQLCQYFAHQIIGQ